MIDQYCKKHEWPAGMGAPCPDCVEIAGLRAEVKVLRDALEAAPDAFRCMDCFSHLPKERWNVAWATMVKVEEFDKK